MCTNPIYAYVKEVYSENLNGEREYIGNKLEFLSRHEVDHFYELKNKDIVSQHKYVTLPCRRCYECQIQNAKEWTLRCMYESKLYESNYFVTLTYAKDPITLIHRDVQLFLKRLRKKFKDLKIRYFGCGEYGSKGKRPHYHLILFNLKLNDLKFLRYSNRKEKLFYSKILESLWSLGYVSIGSVNENTIRYCAKYLQKENNILNSDFIDGETGEVISLKKPYIFMSTKPGIGLNYFLKEYNQTHSLFVHGREYCIPRYYLDHVEDSQYSIIKSKNLILSSMRYNSIEDNNNRNLILKKRLFKFAK